MSLPSFLARPEITALVRPLRPRIPRRLPVETRLTPRTSRYSTVGTAFDYRAPLTPGHTWAGAFFIPSTMRAPWSLTRKIGTMRRVADRNETRALSLAGWAG